jgi:hypothetical protein
MAVQAIVELFNTNVKGKKFVREEHNNHDGEEGHWLEKRMGTAPNGKNEPDLLGYEMKKESSKTTFIDKTPSKIFLKGVEMERRNIEDRELFWTMFQRTTSSNIKIGGWKLDKWDIDGQCLNIDEENNINVLYNYEHDKRTNKNELVSEYYKNNQSHTIISWSKTDMETCINNKWNQNGFFICKKNRNKVYNKICFGNKFSFDFWIEQVKQKNIYCDGYSKSNKWRGCFRSSNKWFYNYITEEY